MQNFSMPEKLSSLPQVFHILLHSAQPPPPTPHSSGIEMEEQKPYRPDLLRADARILKSGLRLDQFLRSEPESAMGLKLEGESVDAEVLEAIRVIRGLLRTGVKIYLMAETDMLPREASGAVLPYADGLLLFAHDK